MSIRKSAHTTDAQTQIAELTEARDWQRASSTDTADAYRQFLAQHPQGKNAQEARIRLENFGLSTSAAAPAAGGGAATARAPTPASPPASPAPSAAPAPAAAPANAGQYSVQLGAFSSHAKAQAHWRHLGAHFAHEFAGNTPDIEAGKRAGHAVFRLKVKGLTEAHAKAICAALRKHAQPCILGRPG